MGPGFTGADGVVENGDEGDAAALVDGSREPLAWTQAPNGNSGAVVGECDAPLSAAYQKQGFLLGAYASHARYASRNLLRVGGMSLSSSFWIDEDSRDPRT